MADLPIELMRKKIKHLYITVKKPDGRVVVSAPMGMRLEQIEQFVWSKREWILGKQAACVQRAEQAALDGGIVITDENREAYRAALKEQIAVLLPMWEERTGLYCNEWRVKDMKTRWGSCNVRDKRIWLNLQLVRYPAECLEYVIVHELCHLQVSNHGAEFKALLDRHMPDWREWKKLLNESLI